MKYLMLLLSLLAAFLVNGQDTEWYCKPDGDRVIVKWYDTALGEQKTLMVRPDQVNDNTNLVVFLHGDSPFGDPVYQYWIARNISLLTNAVTVAILRPGYRDGCGDASGGERGMTYGDNYTTEVVRSLGSVISSIQRELKPAQTIVMGHSGGAALTALLAQSNPTIMDQSVLVACPCNLPAWRQSMQQLTGDTTWLTPMKGLSAIDGISGLDLRKNIHLFVGENDVVAPPFLSTEYHDAVKDLGGTISMEIFAGEEHETMFRRELLERMFENVFKD